MVRVLFPDDDRSHWHTGPPSRLSPVATPFRDVFVRLDVGRRGGCLGKGGPVGQGVLFVRGDGPLHSGTPADPVEDQTEVSLG